MREIRKRVPQVMPSQRTEVQQKKKYWTEFRSILLPRRVSTGWKIDVSRLMDLLSFLNITGCKVSFIGEYTEMAEKLEAVGVLSLPSVYRTTRQHERLYNVFINVR